VHRVRVKIEGLRDRDTALRVAEMGADAIGLVFAASPRRVTPEQAREIVAALPPGVATVGVFVNAGPQEINRTIKDTGIGYVQLHGDEPPAAVGQIAAPCIKAFRVRDERWAPEVRGWLGDLTMCGPVWQAQGEPGTEWSGRSPIPAPGAWSESRREGFAPWGLVVLLDAYDPAIRGGSGRRFNWDLIAHARQKGEMEAVGPVILAGGLDASCVGEAIRKVHPWAVDVASGVESAPGVKDLEKVREFLEAVRKAISEGGFRIAD
jgi:phosphoribosylanthranilate isomerase